MAALIPEAAEAVTSGEAAVSGAGAAKGAKAAQKPAGRRAEAITAKGKSTARAAGRGALRARAPGNRNYQPVILAEFLAAVLVLALAPVAKGGTDTAKAKGSASPYDTNSLKQLLMVGVIYFILALLSSGKNLGRVSAWFGGLVLVGIGVQQTTSGGFAAVLAMFGLNVGSGLGTYPAPGDSGVLPPLNINIGQFSPSAIAQGVQASPNPTDIFPTLEPGGQITPANTTTTYLSPPPGGTGVITTTGTDQGANLALPDAGLALC